MAGNGIGVNDKRRIRRGRNKEKEPDVTICPMCSNKMENPMVCQNTLVLCPHCNEILLVSENLQRKILSPISSEISGCTSPKHVPEPEVCTPRQQYDLALKDPHYLHIMLELVSFIKNKPFRVPVICQGKELNLHRMFVEVTCRGGILKVYLQRRLQEVCAALAENFSDPDLYNIYMTVLYDLEAWLCNFPPAPPLRPCTSYKKVLAPRLREGQHPPQWIQASAPYTNAAPVNNSQQWTSWPAGFSIGSKGQSNRSSSGPCPMPGVILKGGKPSEWIDASARFANSAPMKNNQQAGVNFGSTYHPSSHLSSAVANGNQVWVSASDYKFKLGLDSEDHTLSSLPVPHPTQGLMGGQASEQGIHSPYHNQRMMVKRKLLTESLESEPKTRNLSSLPPNR